MNRIAKGTAAGWIGTFEDGEEIHPDDMVKVARAYRMRCDRLEKVVRRLWRQKRQGFWGRIAGRLVGRVVRLRRNLERCRDLAGQMLGHQHWDRQGNGGATCEICRHQSAVLREMSAMIARENLS